MANCMFLRRRFADKNIPVIIIGANGLSSSTYVTINGINYTGNTNVNSIGVQTATALVGDNITLHSEQNAFKHFVNGAEQTRTNYETVYTVPKTDKIYICISSVSYDTSDLTGKYRGISLTDNDDYILGLYVGSGNTTYTYMMFDNSSSKKYFKKCAAYTPKSSSSKASVKAYSSSQSAPLTVNGVLIGTASSSTAVTYTTNITSGLRAITMDGSYGSSGSHLTINTYY